jgi:antirestriction protein ArdC
MPDDRLFINTEDGSRTENYYSVLLHELTHWTLPEKRCGRDMTGRFGDKAYAMEELVAELGAAFQCAHLGSHLDARH